MLLRKINAVLSLIVSVLLLDHSIFNAVWMLSQGSIAKTTALSWVLFGLMMVHAVLCIIFGIQAHRGKEKQNSNAYTQVNLSTKIQRIGGLLLIPFSVLHMLGTVGIMQPPQAIHAVIPPLFFALCLVHVAISGSKAFITLGIGSAKLIKIVDIAVKALCVATLIASVVGFYLYLC